MGFYLISDKSVVVHWAHHEHTRNTDLRPLPANPTPPPSPTLFCSVDVGHDYYQRQSRNRLTHKLALGFFCSSTQTSPEEWSAEMRDCRGYDEAFNLAAELTLRSLKSLSAKLSQATWHQDGRTSEGGEVVQEEKPRGPLSSHALRTSCNCTRDGSTRTQRGYSNLWK